jgi:hypothetical protein
MGNATSASETDEEFVPIERKKSPRIHSKRSPRQRHSDHDEHYEEHYCSLPKQRGMSPVFLSKDSMPREAIVGRRNDTGDSVLTDDLTHGFTTDEDSCSYGPRLIPQRTPSPLFDDDELTALTDMAHDGDDEATHRERRLGLNEATRHSYTAYDHPIEVPVSFVDDAMIEHIHSPLSTTIVKSPQNYTVEKREQSLSLNKIRSAENIRSITVPLSNEVDTAKESMHGPISFTTVKSAADVNYAQDRDPRSFIEQREQNIGLNVTHCDEKSQSIELSVSNAREDAGKESLSSPISENKVESSREVIEKAPSQEKPNDLIDDEQVEARSEKSNESAGHLNNSFRESRIEIIRRSYEEEDEAENMNGRETMNPVDETKHLKNKVNESKCSTGSSLHIIVPGVDVGEKKHVGEAKRKNKRSVPVVIAFSPKDGSVGENSSTTMDIPFIPAQGPSSEKIPHAPVVVSAKDIELDQGTSPLYRGNTAHLRRPDPPSVTDPRPDDQSIERNTRRAPSAIVMPTNCTDNSHENKQALCAGSMMGNSNEELPLSKHMASKPQETFKISDAKSRRSGSASSLQKTSRDSNREGNVLQNMDKVMDDAILSFPQETTNNSSDKDATKQKDAAKSSNNDNNVKLATVKPTENDEHDPTSPAASFSPAEVKSSALSPASMKDLKCSDFSLQDFDLDMVEKYEDLFNSFLEKNPDLKARNPVMVDILRVAKLQKQLVVTEYIENELDEIVKSLIVRKKAMAAIYHEKLKEASKRKAAREIQLQQELEQAKKETRVMKAKMKWEIVEMCESRSKRNAKLQNNLSSMKSATNHILSLLPENLGAFGESIRQSVNAPSCRFLTQEQYLELQKIQMDNAFLNAKASVLEKKLAYLQTRARNHEWVDSVLKILDRKQHKKLKRSFQTKMGVSF